MDIPIATSNDNNAIISREERFQFLANFDRMDKTPENCLNAVQLSGRSLLLIPKAIQTSELCLLAVKTFGEALQFVSKRIITDEICLTAVKSNGLSLRYVPEKRINEELCLLAVSQTGLALEYVPSQFVTDKLCIIAINNNGLALKFIPHKYITKDLCVKAVELNGKALAYVPHKYKSKSLCLFAVNKYPLALGFVPERLKSNEITKIAVNADWRAFNFVTDDYITLDRCINLLLTAIEYFDNNKENVHRDMSVLREIVMRFSDEISCNEQIIRLERRLQLRKFKSKYYDSESGVFVTKEYISFLNDDNNPEKIEVKEFHHFNEFYSYVDSNLSNANLYDFDFHSVDLRNYNINGVLIKNEILISFGLYDDSFYQNNVRNYSSYLEQTYSADNETIEALSVIHQDDIVATDTLNDTDRKVYYISDIHLNHKIIEAYPNRATKEEITKFIAEFIKKMLITASDKAYGDYLLIAGDVSFSFEISKIFYSILSKKWSPKRIIVVLGNHELWDFNLYRASFAHLNLNEIIQNYRDFFNSIGITFLHNDLFISTNMRDLVITESNLKEFPIDKLRKMGQRSSFIVFGGIGFSGLNRTFNASNGIYRNTITSIEDELAQTKNFRDTYNIISNSLGQNKVIVLTHMPKDDWTEQPYNERWIYVNGHTHRNVYFNDIEKTVYSDNQVGYYSKKIGLKYFYTSRQYDIFLLYPNGIYEISRTEYLDFNRGMGIRCQYNRDGRIHMIKNSNLYCFFYQEKGGGRLHMLNGGSIKYVENQSLEYYYENLKTYEIKINSVFSEYFNTLKRISENIKVIGGDGSIHGCIVDIDFFNHLYLNPFDGTLAAYYATSMNNKWKYSGIKGLLLKQRQDLYNNYIKTLSENPHHIEYIADNVYKSSPEEIPEYMSDTGIYKSSRIIRSIQYIFESKVIRSWNDDLLNPNSMLQLIEFD